MLSFDEAQAFFASCVAPVAETERIWLGGAAGRVLAQDIVASFDAPSVDKSAMDGYAIAAADHVDGRTFPIQQVSYAGMAPERLKPGHAIRLFTGSVMPEGADTVIPEEAAQKIEGGVRLCAAPAPGAHVRRKGEDVSAGTLLIPAGAVLTSGHIASLASQGIDALRVYRLVEVSLLITGDELSFEDAVPASHRVNDVNGPMLESMVESLGAMVVSRRQVRDNERDLHDAIIEMSGEADIVLITGGTSGGERDLVEAALVSAGGEVLCHQVNMKPGMPIALGGLRDKAVVCMPGNPAAAFTTFALLVTPMLRRLQGRGQIYPPVRSVQTELPDIGRSQRDEFFRASVSGAWGARGSDTGVDRVSILAQQAPASVSSLGEATGFVRVGPHVGTRAANTLPFYELDRWLN